jgi:aminoglycoside phosphotransferase family enzyme
MIKGNIQAGMKKNIISIADEVRFMKQVSAYPFETDTVEVKETHMSWVFLVDGWAYKLKKPVKYPFLDLSSAEARLQNAKEEVRLNKRFAKEIYKGVIPITVEKDGKLAINGNGKIADWLVLMKRIPEEDMLDYAIVHQKVHQMQLISAAALLVKYYKKAEPLIIEPEKYRKRLRDDIAAVCLGLSNPLFQLNLPQIKGLAEGLFRFLDEQASLFDQRVNSKKIIEAHGDLKPEHIRLKPRPAIIDCLEFSRELRIQDMAEEISFLAMECEMLGNFDVGNVFFNTYYKLLNDKIPESLVSFFKTKGALRRAFLVAGHLLEAPYQNDPQWINRSNRYLGLAEKHHLLC